MTPPWSTAARPRRTNCAPVKRRRPAVERVAGPRHEVTVLVRPGQVVGRLRSEDAVGRDLLALLGPDQRRLGGRAEVAVRLQVFPVALVEGRLQRVHRSTDAAGRAVAL